MYHYRNYIQHFTDDSTGSHKGKRRRQINIIVIVISVYLNVHQIVETRISILCFHWASYDWCLNIIIIIFHHLTPEPILSFSLFFLCKHSLKILNLLQLLSISDCAVAVSCLLPSVSSSLHFLPWHLKSLSFKYLSRTEHYSNVVLTQVVSSEGAFKNNLKSNFENTVKTSSGPLRSS